MRRVLFSSVIHCNTLRFLHQNTPNTSILKSSPPLCRLGHQQYTLTDHHRYPQHHRLLWERHNWSLSRSTNHPLHQMRILIFPQPHIIKKHETEHQSRLTMLHLKTLFEKKESRHSPFCSYLAVWRQSRIGSDSIVFLSLSLSLSPSLSSSRLGLVSRRCTTSPQPVVLLSHPFSCCCQTCSAVPRTLRVGAAVSGRRQFGGASSFSVTDKKGWEIS